MFLGFRHSSVQADNVVQLLPLGSLPGAFCANMTLSHIFFYNPRMDGELSYGCGSFHGTFPCRLVFHSACEYVAQLQLAKCSRDSCGFACSAWNLPWLSFLFCEAFFNRRLAEGLV